jgi:hypothetical protein
MSSYFVTGTPNPDCTGIYNESGTYGGENAYVREDNGYWLVKSITIGIWSISETKGGIDYEYPSWYGDIGPVGTYLPYLVSGNPIVSEYEPIFSEINLGSSRSYFYQTKKFFCESIFICIFNR